MMVIFVIPFSSPKTPSSYLPDRVLGRFEAQLARGIFVDHDVDAALRERLLDSLSSG